MRPKTLALIIATLAMITFANSQGFGNSELIRNWQFRLESEPDWRPVTVPHDWSVEYPASPDNASCTGYLPGGIGLYKTVLDIPQEKAGKQFYLYFEGVYNRSEVFVNGTSVGKRPNGYVSFLYDITPHVKAGQKNEVTVRVDHSLSADSRWYTGSGIYRPAHLVTANPIHIAQWGTHYTTTTNVNGQASVSVETKVQNHDAKSSNSKLTVVQELSDGRGISIAKQETALSITSDQESIAHSQLSVPQAKLWSVKEPNLYTLKTTVLQGGEAIDSSVTTVGIRTLTFDPDKGFALNGDWMKLKGVCLHHDAGVLGAAVPKVVWRERLLQLKEIGCNAIRMSHNPQATALYDLCDELGFLVMDEAFDEWEYPKKKWLTGWNKGTPGFQGTADYFLEWGERDLEAMVMRDRNHPSIIMWSIGNEVDYPNDPYSHPILDQEGIEQQHVAGYKKDQPPAERLGDIAKRLAAVVRKHDSSRPVTAALAGAVMSNETAYPTALDVVGYNYTENRYQMDHEKYPNRILYGSENRHDYDAWKSVTENEYIFGQFLWTGFDYLGEAGAWPDRGFSTGLIDQANNIKPRGYYRRALWAENPVAYLGAYSSRDPESDWVSMDAPHSWNFKNREKVRVVCYTNGDEAQLFLNGKPIGDRKPFDKQNAIIHWDIPFKKGELKVVSYQNGQAVATDSIRTDQSPAALQATAREETLAGKYAVSVIPVSLVDSEGRPVTSHDLEITCTLKGPGKLLGLENASRDASENHRDNVATTHHGRLVAYVQATADSGTFEIEFTAKGLESTSISMPILHE